MERPDLRNIALVAHVDHGKTTVVEQMIRFAAGLGDAVEPIADALAFPVVRMTYQGVAVNVIDTPSQVDFGGEAERALRMADGVLLLVDAFEGPLPHTRFALRRAIQFGYPIVVVINKVDRHDADPQRVVRDVRSLLKELEASHEQIDAPVVYAVARLGLTAPTLDVAGGSFGHLFDVLLKHIPAPRYDPDERTSFWVHHRVHDDEHGPLAIGRVRAGTLKSDHGVTVHAACRHWTATPTPMLYFDGCGYQAQPFAMAGDVLAVAGLGQVREGDVVTTVCERPPCGAMRREEPTLELTFGVNKSPMAGKSRASNFLTARHIERRLSIAASRNSGVRFELTDCADTFRVFVRGEHLLASLVETMRREGYEMELGRPEVATRQLDGQTREPVELAVIDVPAGDVGLVTQQMLARGGRLVKMSDPGFGRAHLEFRVRSRDLLACRSELRRATRGMAIVTTLFDSWAPWIGLRDRRPTGAIVADRDGRATSYALFHLQPRGVLFHGPGAPVYAGMVVGEHNRGEDIHVNVTKEPKVADVRSRGWEQVVWLTPPVAWSLESALAWLDSDELLEVTPESLRLRKVP